MAPAPAYCQARQWCDVIEESETWHVSREVFVMITLMTSQTRGYTACLCLSLLPNVCSGLRQGGRGGGNTRPQLSSGSGSESRRHQRAQSDLGLGTSCEAWSLWSGVQEWEWPFTSECVCHLCHVFSFHVLVCFPFSVVTSHYPIFPCIM